MTKSHQTSRRCFLKTSVLTAVSAPTIIHSSALGQAGKPAPSNRITVGLVGCGGRGVGVMNSFLREPNAQVIATCDPYETHYRGQGKGRALGRKPAAEMVGKKYGSKPCDTYADYRDLCARDDIDVVIVATPDHWHAVQALEALRNGKDIYCEKPVTHFFAEGQALYREVAKRGAIFQTGSQQRSATVFRNAVELVRNGLIGKVKEVQVGLPKGPDKIKGDPTEEDRSGREDYQHWTGPAPMLPYVHARHHQMWRVHLAYGGGQLMDWIGHHNDIAHWGLGEDQGGPIRVEAKELHLESRPGLQGTGALRGALRVRRRHPNQHRHTQQNGYQVHRRGGLGVRQPRQTRGIESRLVGARVHPRQVQGVQVRQPHPQLSRVREEPQAGHLPGGNVAPLHHARPLGLRLQRAWPRVEMESKKRTMRWRQRGQHVAQQDAPPQTLDTWMTAST